MSRSALLVLLAASPGFAQFVSYDGTAFPEDTGDGWVRSEWINLADRSLEDGWLVQSPVLMPCPPDCTTKDSYRRELTDQAGVQSWALSWRMVTDGPPAYGAVAPASIVASGQSDIRYHFTIGEDQIRLLRSAYIPHVFADFDPGPHLFRLELQNTGDTGTYSFMIDGEVIDTGVAEGFYPTDDSFVVFGARAAIEDSVTRWDWIQFGDPTAPIPAVSHWGIAVLTLLVVTAATLVFRHQRRPLPLPQGG